MLASWPSAVPYLILSWLARSSIDLIGESYLLIVKKAAKFAVYVAPKIEIANHLMNNK